MQHITSTERQLLDYNTNLGITREEIQSEIDQIEVDITDIRYIILRKRHRKRETIEFSVDPIVHPKI